MSVIDRLRSRVEAVVGTPLSKHVDASAACGIVLADSSLCRDYALAYRAVVDAVYAEAELDADTNRVASGVRPGDPGKPGRNDENRRRQDSNARLAA
jgi:hypothetical protein